jgi:hypothetical protein
VLEALTKKGGFLGDRKMRMGKGLQFSEPEPVLVFSNEDEKIFAGEEMLNADARNPD